MLIESIPQKIPIFCTGVSNVEKGSWIEQSEQMVKKCSWSCGVPKTINFEMFKPGLFG